MIEETEKMKLKKIFFAFAILAGVLSLVSCSSLPRSEGYGPTLPVATSLVADTNSRLEDQMNILISLQKKTLETLTSSKSISASAESVWKKSENVNVKVKVAPVAPVKKVNCGVSKKKFNRLEKKVDRMSNEIHQMNKVLTLHGVKLEEIGKTEYHVYRIGFPSGSSDINKKAGHTTAAGQIKAAVLNIEKMKETIISIYGYTDEDGSANSNKLDESRAMETYNQVRYHRGEWIKSLLPTAGGSTNKLGIKSGSQCALIICRKSKTAK